MTNNERMKHRSWLGSFAAALLLAGCSSEKNDKPAAADPSKVSSASAAHAGTNLVAQGGMPRSKFTVNPELRDPFFPNSKTAVRQIAGNSQTTANMDVPALLQAGFVGVIVAGNTRIANIN